MKIIKNENDHIHNNTEMNRNQKWKHIKINDIKPINLNNKKNVDLQM